MDKTKEIQNIRQLFLKRERDLPCSLVVKTALPMQGCRTRDQLRGETWIPQAAGHGEKKKKEKKIC